MARVITIPAEPAFDVTQRVEGLNIDYENEIVRVYYKNVETGVLKKVNLPTSVFDTVVTALNPDRLWTYIDNQA